MLNSQTKKEQQQQQKKTYDNSFFSCNTKKSYLSELPLPHKKDILVDMLHRIPQTTQAQGVIITGNPGVLKGKILVPSNIDGEKTKRGNDYIKIKMRFWEITGL